MDSHQQGEDTNTDTASTSDCDWEIVENSEIEQEENTHQQSSIFSFLSDTAALSPEDFATFFVDKVATICSSFPQTDMLPTHSQPTCATQLHHFTPLSHEELSQILTASNPTTCSLDPIPSGSFLTSLGEKVGFIDKKTYNEGFPHLKIVLVGRSGIGKSTLFNSLVVNEEFTTDPAKQSATEHCEIFHGVRDGRHITVIDTPGFFSSQFSNEQVADKIQTDIKMASPGPFLFLLVVEVDNFTSEDTETANIIEKILDGSIANMMVVFTQGCRLKSTIEEYVQGSNENLQKLLEKCEQRYLVLYNTAMNLQHLKELFKINDQLIQKDGFWKDGNVEETERVSKRKSSLDVVPPDLSYTPSE